MLKKREEEDRKSIYQKSTRKVEEKLMSKFWEHEEKTTFLTK
jgi:hypothetical protein